MIDKTPIAVLVFNPRKKLVGMFYSLTAAAHALNTSTSNVQNACCGKMMSTCGLYVRNMPSEFEIEPSDYGTLDLEDFDRMCGVERRYYPNTKMNRVGMKYEMKPKRRNHPKHNGSTTKK